MRASWRWARWVSALVLASCGDACGARNGTAPVEPAAEGSTDMRIESSSFTDQGEIPSRHTCEGDETSPPLAWSDAPEGTRSYALIVADPDAPDPDAPRMTWIHWVIYDIPATVTALPEGVGDAPPGARAGTNSWNRPGYGGPCPPIGRHRYFFRLYALDAALGDRGALTSAELESAVEGHVLARAELMGTYRKQR